MRTCLFGGTFDPVHSGHLAMARAMEQQLAPDRVVFLPAVFFHAAAARNHAEDGTGRLAHSRGFGAGPEHATAELELARGGCLDISIPGG